SVRRPEDVDRIATPSPPRTLGSSVDLAYTRRPGFEMRRTPEMARSRLSEYFSSRTRFLPTSASSSRAPRMYPSAFRMSAMWLFNFEYGIDTVSWYAPEAFRIRVSMSAIGSVMVMSFASSSPGFPPSDRDACGGSPYQLLSVTPASSPRSAISRRHTRQSPNLRYTDCGRPQRWHRV